MAERIIRALSNVTEDGREVRQGETVDLSDADVERMEASGSLVPEGWESFDAFHDATFDAYRAGRGDTVAAERTLALRAAAAKGGTVDVDGEDVTGLADWLRDEKPSAEDTVAAAQGDPERATQLLEAENLATGQKPRKTVEAGLTKIIEGGE